MSVHKRVSRTLVSDVNSKVRLINKEPPSLSLRYEEKVEDHKRSLRTVKESNTYFVRSETEVKVYRKTTHTETQTETKEKNIIVVCNLVPGDQVILQLN